MTKTGFLTNHEGLFEGRPGDVVPRRPAGRVDCALAGAQQGGRRLGLACGAFWWGHRWGQRAAGGMACEAVQRILTTPAEGERRAHDVSTPVADSVGPQSPRGAIRVALLAHN